MTGTAPPRDWTDLHWPDITPATSAGWIAVLPLAATEQHGPHLPLGTDVMIAQAYLDHVREVLPAHIPAIFLPIQPVGISTEHIAYPGTLTLPADVAIGNWMAIGESIARAGLRKLVMVSSHGSSEPSTMRTFARFRHASRNTSATTSSASATLRSCAYALRNTRVR